MTGEVTKEWKTTLYILLYTVPLMWSRMQQNHSDVLTIPLFNFSLVTLLCACVYDGYSVKLHAPLGLCMCV